MISKNIIKLIKISFFTILFTIINSSLFAQSGKYYLVDINPWGQTNTDNALNTVFGTNAWTKSDYSTISATTIFSASNSFVMIEGGDGNQNFPTYMSTNQSTIENWVASGGELFIKVAPNYGSNIPIGFLSTIIIYPNFSANVSLTTEGINTIGAGPSLPMATTFTGGSYAHATISGTAYTNLITSNGGGGFMGLTSSSSGESVLSYKRFGSGKVTISTMTDPNFIDPKPQSQNLLINTISFASSSAAHSFTNPGPITMCELGSYYLAPSTTEGTWATSTPTVAIVNSSGYVTALTAGVTDITLTSSGVTITATITVQSAATYSGAPTIQVGQPSYKISNTSPVSQGPTADLFMGYSGFNYSSSTKPTNPGFYRANNVVLANKTAGCPFPFEIFRCTTCPD
jgi:hypothetical protein